MGDTGMKQGGMGFQPEIKSQGFGMRQMDSPGSFLGGSSETMGMKSMPLRTPERHMGPQGLPQRFSSPSNPMTQAQPRMVLQNQEIPSIVNRVVTHSSDHLRRNPKTPLQETAHLAEKKPLNSLGMFGNLNPDMGMKPGPSSSLGQMSKTQNRYTNESASSILESFGLSNEDLEELSRYPDDQLTPENLPNILRDIRLRKINRTGGTHDQGGGGRRSGGEVLPSKVIDYGHSSKFKFNDNSAPSRPFDSSRTEQKPSPVSKQPAASNANKNKKGNNAMDNKIPTISSSRKSSWQASKLDRSNNKTLVGEPTTAKASDSSATILTAENPVITIQPDSTPLCDVPVILDTVATTSSPAVNVESPIGTVVSQVNYPPPAEATPPTGKGNWAPSLPQEEAQKQKRMPTPSMMNDYFAASPRIFPHICSLCNVECRHLKDWIKHQNTTTHIDSCRKLRQQYPDWNPQVHTLRNEGKKDEANPKISRSKSGSPRRTRRSGSRSRARRSRSRSPRSGRRSRSRSPRRSRHSPRRSRSPRKGTRSPRRSPSPRRPRRGRSSTPPDKRAVDAAVQSFIEASKLKSGEKPRLTKPSPDPKKLTPKPANPNVKGKKPAASPAVTNTGSMVKKTSSSSSYSSTSKKPGSSSSVKSGSSSNGSAPRRPFGSNTGKKPVTASSSAPKKPVVSTGAKRTSTVPNKKPQMNKMSNAQKGPSKQPASEPYNPLNKFTSKSASDKVIHVTNLPDSGYTDQDILKIVQPFGKVCDILIIRSKNEAFLETNFKEAASAAVKFSETKPVIINGKHVVLSLAGQHKEPSKTETKGTSDAESKPSPQKAAPAKEHKEVKPHKEENRKKKPGEPKHNIEVPPGFIKCHRLADPPLKDAEKCVVVISNLPDKYTVEEISNLARPFGGVNDILVISNYRKAYLELPSRNSVDSMLKFYNVFPTCLSGNTLTIAMAPRYKDLKNENLIFAEIIEQTQFKITPTIYERFVHLANLPDSEIEEFALTRIGLRFGKVEHYIVMSNRRRAILHLNTPGAAKGMHTFLSRFPARIGESVLTCSLVAKTTLPEGEYITYLEEMKSSKPDQNTHEEVAPPILDEVSQLEEQQPLSADHVVEAEEKAEGTFANVEEEEDDDDDEEAAEAPEAPEAPSSYFIHPEPVVEQCEYSEAPQTYLAAESDVLVSVESDEEECEAPPCPSIPSAVPVMDSVSMEHMLTAEDSEESESHEMETSANEMLGDCPKPVENASAVDDLKPEDAGKEELSVEASQDAACEPTKKESEGSSAVISPSSKEETIATRAEENSDKETKSECGRSPREGRSKRSEEMAQEDKSRQRRERSRQSSQGNVDELAGEASEGSKDAEQAAAAAASKASLTRTAKYNPQRGELSVTLTVDSQKSSSRTPDTRKRFSGDRGSSGRESSTPKSSSNRSSPSESASSNPKTGTGLYQTKSSYRGASAQDRDSKVTSRSRESDSRSNRKDDRSKDSNSSSSRYTRSSNRSTRGQRSKEEGEDSFPFNLDEFVTVDEIVEEPTDSVNQEEEESKKSEVTGTPRRGGKRKENYPSDSCTKKPKEAAGEAPELSFVTLDEVGDEEEKETTPAAESIKDVEAPSLVTVDEVHAEDSTPPSTQDSSVLMTLDEVSDDEEPNASAIPSGGSSAIPDKDQLLTLDEVSGEDEEQTSHSEPSNPDTCLTQKTESKENSSVDPETKASPDTPVVPPQEPNPESHVEQTLLTLDEVKADDDDEEFLGDIEHQFLTVDEIGEEEEDLEAKEEEVEKPQPKSASKSAQRKSSPKPTGRRGRPRKHPLSETPASKDTSEPTSADSSMVSEPKTPKKTKAKAAKGANQSVAEDSTIPTPERVVPDSSTPKASETPAKKTKLESPSTEKKKLGPFNSSVPVGLEFLVPKTGFFCELCSLFYMDDASKIKHCKSLRHYQSVQKHLSKEEEETAEGKSTST
ncbi:PREDICTED: zinc finger protein 638 [Nanorana parkeri]|uniref:zinc finger protein 638 n=1 Tax=Nanorana parkeri TaxID=125878 RepID=UPI000854FEB0|nr:PREDICTED: zinc finger protein 638 [Nanorana parkeri]